MVGIVGGTATASARSLSHHLSFGITLAMVIAITAFLAWESRKRRAAVESKYGPLTMCLFASLLIMADPTRHLLQDTHVWVSGRHECGTQHAVTPLTIMSVRARPGCVFIFLCFRDGWP